MGDLVDAVRIDMPPLDAPEILDLHELLADDRASEQPRAVPVPSLLEALARYAGRLSGSHAGRSAAFYEAAALRLLEGLAAAWRAGVFGGGRLLYLARPEEAGDARVLELQGDASTPAPMGTAAYADRLAPGRLYVQEREDVRSLHPWVVFRSDGLREQVFFLCELAPSVGYLDYISGEVLLGHELEAAFPGLEAEARNLLVLPAPEAPGEFRGEDRDRFGDFDLLDTLGVGGMGTVHLARQRSIDRLVALKLLPLAESRNPAVVQRFEREMSALRRCDHPHVVKILASGRAHGTPYYAMEYVEGVDLAEVGRELPSEPDLWGAVSRACGRLTTARASAGGRLPTPSAPGGRWPRSPLHQIGAAFRDAARGLHHIHEHGIVHRDVKPGNLMITARDARIVVMDLGLALLADSGRSLTQARTQILGTLRYMAPEQLQGNRMQVDRRADIYSLGATFYELFTGHPFLTGDTEPRLIEQILREDPRAPRDANPRIPRDLETILRKATQKDPGRRYETAEALARDLESWIDGRPISARPPTFRYLAALAIRRHRALAIALAAGFVALAASTTFFLTALAAERERALARAEDAVRERARAEELAAFMLFDMRDELQSINRLDLLAKVARKARKYYDSLLPDERNPGREFGHAKALEALGAILEAQGALSDSLEANRSALRILEGLASADPGVEERRIDIAVVRNRIGDVQIAQGDLDGALASFREGERLLEELLSARPDSRPARRALVTALIDVGSALRRRGDLAEAATRFARALEIAEEVQREDPLATGPRRDVLVAQTNVADVHLAQGDLAGALLRYEAALEVVRALVRDHPTDANLQRDLFVNLTRTGDVLKAQGKLGEALERYRAGASVVERLAGQDPDNTHWQRDLLLSHQILGDLLVLRGDVKAAFEERRRSLSIAETLSRYDPTNTYWLSDLASCHKRLGELHQASGDSRAALDSYGAALEIQERLLARTPKDVNVLSDIAEIHGYRGEVLLDLRDLGAALRSYGQALETRRQLVQEDPTNAVRRHDLSVNLFFLGEVRVLSGDLHEGLAAHREGMAIVSELVQRDPTNTRWRRSLGLGHGKVGDALLALGETEPAAKEHESGLEILRHLTREEPTNALWQRDVSIAHDALARIALQRNDYQAALAHRRLAAENHRALVERAPQFEREARQLGEALRVAELLAGAREPAGSLDLARLARAHYHARDYESAAALFAEALEDPALRADPGLGVLYDAACAAALVTGSSAEQWRERALQWLREDLQGRRDRVLALEAEAVAGGEAARAAAAAARDAFKEHLGWAEKGDPDLASLRGSPAFSALFRDGAPVR